MLPLINICMKEIYARSDDLCVHHACFLYAVYSSNLFSISSTAWLRLSIPLALAYSSSALACSLVKHTGMVRSGIG